MLGRGLASDVNGAYPKNEGSIGQIKLKQDGTPEYNHYNTDAIWGGYWNLTNLWAIAYPEYYNDWVQSQVIMYKDAGWLGDGIAASKYVSGVGTNMVSIALAGAYNSGIRDFDVETAYQAALKMNWNGKGVLKVLERWMSDNLLKEDMFLIITMFSLELMTKAPLFLFRIH